MSHEPLDRVIIIYETEEACRARLRAAGFDTNAADEIACYLAQATDIVELQPEITSALSEVGVEAVFLELDALPSRWRDWSSASARTMLWCQTDGFAYFRGSAVPAFGRLAGLPSYGSPPQAQHLCQDKFKCLTLAAAIGLRVPPSALLEGTRVVAGEAALDRPGPLFVKPNTLGAKIGIFGHSRCSDGDAARAIAARLSDRYRDRAVVQPFIPGDDLRVSFMDLGAPLRPSLGIARLEKDPRSETAGAFLTMTDNLTLSGSRDTAGGRTGFGIRQQAAFVPKLTDVRREAATNAASAAIVAEVEVATERLVAFFGLRDCFSVDFRVAETGEIYFLEFEVCPAVTIYDFQAYLHAAYGLTLGPALTRSLLLAHERRPTPDL